MLRVRANSFRHLNGSLDYLLYHGRARSESVNKIEEKDIVITTYNTLAKEHSAKLLGQGKSPLHEIKWHRIVLDEGQFPPHSMRQWYSFI